MLLGVAVAALAVGILYGALHESESEKTGKKFASAWQAGDYPAMYKLLTPAARGQITATGFKDAYKGTNDTATATSVKTGDVSTDGENVKIPVKFSTRVFGPIKSTVQLHVTDKGVDWKPNDTFPGVPAGARLTRESRVPTRATITAVGGQTIVSGPATNRVAQGPAASIAGEMGAPKGATEQELLYARGFPRDAIVGATGLERALDEEVAGKPGGRLLAAGKVLARSHPRPADAVRSTIDANIQQAANNAIGGNGGVAALDAKTAEIRALAGIAFSAPQPPGSTFKIITTTAALEDHEVKLSDSFPVQTGAVIEGFTLNNASHEACGGSFAHSFAESCNSVFAPLGVKVGAKSLVRMAERYGWNEQPTIQGAKASTIPPAKKIPSQLEVGASAIGQDRVLATPLQMASASQVVASRGIRREPTLVPGKHGKTVRVMSPKIARTLEKLMVGVVAEGTGDKAQIPGVTVAGKTGTAELGGNLETDGWFTAYAPVSHPELAVAVLKVQAGFGGDVAAPVAKQVLQAGIK